MYLRMINKKAKWEQSKLDPLEEISSDAITGCLRTQNETLSLWKIEDEAMISDAIIALASNREIIQKLDYLIIPDSEISEFNLELREQLGESPYHDFNKNHLDIINLNYYKLGVVSNMIRKIINSDKGRITRVNEVEIEKLLCSAIEENKINIEDLSESLAEKLMIKLGNQPA